MGKKASSKRAFKKALIRKKEKHMTIGSHLEELRRRIIACLLIIIVLTIIIFLFSSRLHEIIYQTIFQKVKTSLILENPYGGIQILIKISLYSALILSWPVNLTILWRFIAPALTKKNMILGQLLVFLSSFFFLIGIFFAWRYLIPVANQFLLVDTLPHGILPQLPVERYYAFVFTLFFTSGSFFQLPILFILLGLANILSYQWHTRHWKSVTTVIFVLAALLTPPDPISQILLGSMILSIYIFTIWVLYFIFQMKRKNNPNNG